MKAKDLIKELSKYPGDTDVCIFDWRKNIHHSNDEPCSVGIESDFEVVFEKDAEPNFIALSFENDDYTNSGDKVE